MYKRVAGKIEVKLNNIYNDLKSIFRKFEKKTSSEKKQS